MSNVTTIKGNLFDAPQGTILIHACNCKGSWGAGIAKEFSRRYPLAYHEYRDRCLQNGSLLLGTALILSARKNMIGCLFTSKGYGRNVGTEQSILENTRLAVEDLIKQNTGKLPLHMCKINSGLFGVDWNKTKGILKEFKDQQFTVYDY